MNNKEYMETIKEIERLLGSGNLKGAMNNALVLLKALAPIEEKELNMASTEDYISTGAHFQTFYIDSDMTPERAKAHIEAIKNERVLEDSSPSSIPKPNIVPISISISSLEDVLPTEESKSAYEEAVSKFEVVCDDTNNSPEDVANNRLNVDISPPITVEEVSTETIVTNVTEEETTEKPEEKKKGGRPKKS